MHQSKIIDAEVIPDDENPPPSSPPPPQSLIEYSQNQDPDWKSMPVAFCDVASNTYVDCNLAFYARDPLGDGEGGAEYALGVPCEVPIVVALELDGEDGASAAEEEGAPATVVSLDKVVPINPDDGSGGGVLRDEEKEEVFQMAARALMDEFGRNVRLKKTPRVLTLEGDLDGVLGDWKEVLLGGGGSSEKEDEVGLGDLLKMFGGDDDDGEDYFDKIMRRDLGDDYESLVDDDEPLDEMDKELLKLFDMSESEKGDDVDMDDLLDDLHDLDSKMADLKDATYDSLVRNLRPSAALKLINFLGPGGREYTVLRPLRPILLVGKEDPDDYTRRILLTEEEAREVLPRLESACREGLEEAGFFLAGSGEEGY